MDAIISSALEEICSQGQNGLSLSYLWTRLNIDNSPYLQASVYSNLLKVPSLHFQSPKNGAFDANDAQIQRIEEAEKLGLKIVACSQLRDNFVGLYDKSSNSGISAPQRRALERLAIARSDGITQNQLAKEFGIEGNNFFYVVKNLECKGLIVKQPAVLRTKEAGSQGESKNSSCVITNLIYLYRYAKHLGSQQRFEISKEGPIVESVRDENEKSVSGDGFPKESAKDDVHIKDFLPAMKAVCDKLEEANGKVLVVTDIKQDLGYCGSSSGHKAWRNICQRLKDAGIVEEFEAQVNERVERCLRLLKQFSSKLFEPQCLRCGDNSEKDELKFGRRFPKTEQLVELPIEHQIYDMVDAEGSEGLAVMEVCERLGIDKKKNYSRFCNMFSRFRMHLQAENHKKTVAFRVWTSGNSNPRSSNAFLSKLNLDVSNLDDDSCGPAQTFLENNPSAAGGDFANPGDKNDVETNTEISHEQELLYEPSGMAAEGELVLSSMAVEANESPAETKLVALPKPVMNPSPSLTPNYLRREQRILERLQDDKIILRAELQRWLMSLEDTCTSIDRKGIARILLRLQQQGHCKCLNINVPAITNCGRTRSTQVVLHPSLDSLTPDLLSEIHDRIRRFEVEIRGRSSSKLKKNESVPVLDGVQRTQRRVDSDEKAFSSEAMRANGFVLAKMVRAKLLHSFLWDYLSSSSGWNDAVPSGKHLCGLNNPHSSCYLFSLEAAIKNIPLELFLQVVGSTKKFDDMIENCKRGICLSDLSIQEYRHMMNTQATGRLSVIIDILRRLKLIRLVSNGHSDDGVKISHANLTHAMELRPYIEEPPITATTSSFTSLDLRPRIRHDFILSNREVVNEYWQTLEYCYAAADPTAALHAFPGSAVHEVFHYRSWASVSAMTAVQRAELLKRIGRDNVHEKIPFKECQKIVKDLDLTLEQVLRVYYNKRQRLNRSQKRKKSLEERPVKRKRVDAVTRLLGGFTGTANEFMKERNPCITYSGEHDFHQKDNHLETVEELELNEGDEDSLVSQGASSKMRPSRRTRFSWTDEADRQLVIQYVRHRAALGAKFHRVDWPSLANLPASARACARRMSTLKGNAKCRKAIMKLCNMLSQRYAKHLEKSENMSLDDNNCRVLKRSSFKECPNLDSSKQWDDFDDKNIQRALEDILRLKQMAKWEASEKNLEESGLASPLCEQNLGMEQQKDPAQRTKFYPLHQNVINGRINASKRVSLAVSSAIELFKVVFLSASTAPELPNLLAETLRRYSEHDLFAAFSHLRERKFMIGGDGNPFVLSQLFLQSVSKSPFPSNTGKRAAKFSGWLNEKKKDLEEGGVNLSADLQCGDIFHLFSLVSSGELSVSACLPDEGVGEAEDLRCLKRKSEDSELHGSDKGKKLKYLTEGELISRREKGFPGIMVSVHRATISVADAVDLFKDGEICIGELCGNAEFKTTLEKNDGGITCQSDYMKEILNFGHAVPIAGSSNESPWDLMTAYAEYLSSPDQKQISFFSPQVFKAVYSAIQKAGDQGLGIKEVSCAVDMPGEKFLELVIDVLEAFGRVLKVNAYDSVRVVDALYRSKYFLTSTSGFSQDCSTPSLTKILSRNYDSQVQPENHDIDDANSGGDIRMNGNNVHKVTILNLPEDVSEPLDETQTGDLHEVCMQGDDMARRNNEDESYICSSTELCTPILPWINGDGTVNSFVYNGLLRRVFGTVMQNPGILEDEIIRRTDVINPQSCKKLLELMILDGHLITRKMHQQSTYGKPPAILNTLFGSSFRNSEMVYPEHFFANPKSTSIL
ncbi:B-block binding subunit of TFIIIC [Melia azedarach]|uniref:B-block binding subunit of TFIIIC n=1 Tax=Melia azedarach TaxID=155640 RepID=A0ACC1Y270_MELAZ|nr:B-block binding subunit of TFIIIC [Melia azedarach]